MLTSLPCDVCRGHKLKYYDDNSPYKAVMSPITSSIISSKELSEFSIISSVIIFSGGGE